MSPSAACSPLLLGAWQLLFFLLAPMSPVAWKITAHMSFFPQALLIQALVVQFTLRFDGKRRSQHSIIRATI